MNRSTRRLLFIILFVALAAGIFLLSTTAQPYIPKHEWSSYRPASTYSPTVGCDEHGHSNHPRNYVGVTDKRPTWGRQILLTDLRPNMFVRRIYGPCWNDDSLYLVMSAAYTKDGECRYDAVYWGEGWPVGRFLNTEYCSSSGLVPYEHGWSKDVHLEPANLDPLTDQQFKALGLFLTPAP